MAYQDPKQHQGTTYRGMKVGGVHRWSYPDGTWKERKIEPSRWEFTYASHKHRAGKAPRGSGAEVGSGYHWYITSHQWVRKVDANVYQTFMQGMKHLVAFQKPDWGRWNTQFRNQPNAKEKVKRFLHATLQRLDDEDPIENPWDADLFTQVGLKGAEEEPASAILRTLLQDAKKQDVTVRAPKALLVSAPQQK